MVFPVGLDDAELELALAQRVQIVDRTGGRLDGAADAVLLAVLVHQPADGTARGIVHPGDTACADADKALFRRGRSAAPEGHADTDDGGGGQAYEHGSHLNSSLVTTGAIVIVTRSEEHTSELQSLMRI